MTQPNILFQKQTTIIRTTMHQGIAHADEQFFIKPAT
jgi:hypothetical protein